MPELTSADYSNLIAEKEKEISAALENQIIFEQSILSLQKDILEKQVKKKEYEITNSKAKHNLRKLSIEKSLLDKLFWHAKNSGI